MKKFLFSLLILVTFFPITVFGVTSTEKNVSQKFNLNATVSSIKGSVVTLKDGKKIYKMEIDKMATYYRKFGARANIKELTVGDTVQTFGVKNGNKIIISSLKDQSKHKSRVTFEGVVENLDKKTTTFYLRPNKKSVQKVFVSLSTKISFQGKNYSFNKLKDGTKINLKGIWDSKNNIIRAENIVVQKQIKNDVAIKETVPTTTLKNSSSSNNGSNSVASEKNLLDIIETSIKEKLKVT